MSGKDIAIMIVGISVALMIGVAILPTALDSWYSAGQVGGALANMSAEFLTMWNLVPVFVALAIILSIVAIALHKLGTV